jgi:hypothetical protein
MCNKLLKHGDFNGCLELTSDSVRSISDGACGLTMDSDHIRTDMNMSLFTIFYFEFGYEYEYYRIRIQNGCFEFGFHSNTYSIVA